MTKYIYVKRVVERDGKLVDLDVVDIPEEHLSDTLKRHPNWYVIKETNEEKPDPVIQEVNKVEDVNVLKCPLCDKPQKNELALKIHKGRYHK